MLFGEHLFCDLFIKMAQKNKVEETKMSQTKLEYVARCLSKGTSKKFETYVVNEIYAKLNNFNLEISTQQYVRTKEGRKYIDLYFPQLKIAVEVDEGYHDNLWQKDKDAKRMSAIKLSILESMILDDEKEIKFLRIPVVSNENLLTIEDLDKIIDDTVNQINEIAKNKNLTWNFNREVLLNKIKQRGYLQRGDNFSSMVEILHVFGKKVKGWQKCSYKNIWSPTLSVDGSNRNGWVNTISEDLTEIYESGVGIKQNKKQSDVDWDIKNQTKRYVFLKYRDALNNAGRRFLGVYMADRFDGDKKAEVWKLISDRVDLHNL